MSERPCTCDRFTPGRPLDPARDCSPCWLWHHHPGWRGAFGGDPADARPPLAVAPPAPARAPVAPPPAALREPCPHLGAPTGATVTCPSCTGKVELKLFSCAVHGRCTVARRAPGVACCQGCPDHPAAAVAPPPAVAAVTVTPRRTIDLTEPMSRGAAAMNLSLADHRGELWACWRLGWERSRLCLQRLGDDLRPRGPRHLLLLGQHPEDRHAQEDPRLFVHGGRLHVAYTGYAPGPRGWYTSVCLAELDPGRGANPVVRSWCPRLEGRTFWEKNWTPFEDDRGNLNAVYSIRPHTVLRLTGDLALPVYTTAWEPGWEHGLLRGGACPVRVGPEWWCFFHGWRPATDAGTAHYTVALYAFDAAPPFAPRRIARAPVLYPGPPDGRGNPRVIFPGGAVRRPLSAGAPSPADEWVLAYGHHDLGGVRVSTFGHAELDRLLAPV